MNHCPRCHRHAQVLKTHRREVTTLSIGHFIAHETQLFCPHCPGRPVFLAAALHQLVPRGARYGYDVMTYVGEALFLRCRNGKEIQCELATKNINISLREIDHLGRRFIVYLAVTHEQSQAKLKQFMDSRGGYILHLDGTCEGDSPHLMSTMDELS